MCDMKDGSGERKNWCLEYAHEEAAGIKLAIARFILLPKPERFISS